MNKNELFPLVDSQQDRLFDLACQIFDRPECNGQEYFASQLLADTLEAEGFQVERGVGGQETAFRATWSNGSGGINIGILGEYDALPERGHACGHHMQTPAAIGAAVAVKTLLGSTQLPFTLTVYGTPAEETYGGKIRMQENGCFRELDVALSTHATARDIRVAGLSMALNSYRVIFHGRGAHASASPHLGRSAADAMFLSFNGIEFMREHIKDGTRMHYSVREALPPSNVVPDRAVGGYTLRYMENGYLKELDERFRDIIKGACLMAGTEAEILQQTSFAANVRNDTLAQVAKDNAELLGLPISGCFVEDSKGSTDFGNVSATVPGVLVYVPYYNAASHSQEWLDQGKSDCAKSCIMSSAKVLAGILYDLILDPSIGEAARKEFEAARS